MYNPLTYSEQLACQEWKEKRIKILERDNYSCRTCQRKLETRKMHVHHELYMPNIYAWECPDEYLTTLCQDCHNSFHKKIKPQTLRVEVGSKKYEEVISKYPELIGVDHFTDAAKWKQIKEEDRIMRRREPVPEYNVAERLDTILSTIYNFQKISVFVAVSEYEFGELERSSRFIKNTKEHMYEEILFYEHVYGSTVWINDVNNWEFSRICIPSDIFDDEFPRVAYKREYAINPRTNELFGSELNENVYWFG